MNMRALPGMLAPRYQELQLRNTVCEACIDVCDPGAFGLPVASIVAWPCASSQAMHSAIQSTWCSIERITLVKAEVLPAPAMWNRFGKPATVKPR